jgi:hypothetical protein
MTDFADFERVGQQNIWVLLGRNQNRLTFARTRLPKAGARTRCHGLCLPPAFQASSLIIATRGISAVILKN